MTLRMIGTVEILIEEGEPDAAEGWTRETLAEALTVRTMASLEAYCAGGIERAWEQIVGGRVERLYVELRPLDPRTTCAHCGLEVGKVFEHLTWRHLDPAYYDGPYHPTDPAEVHERT